MMSVTGLLMIPGVIVTELAYSICQNSVRTLKLKCTLIYTMQQIKNKHQSPQN